MKYFLPAFSALLITVLFSCNGNGNETTGTPEEGEQPTMNETFEQRVKREAEAKLQIPATEKYSLRIYKAYINSDTVQDAIITVNRMQFAMDQAIKMKKTAQAAELGYTGNYNYLFFYDGAIDMISDAIPAPSSPGRELDISFQSITSPNKKDVLVDYRIRNSGWRCYFTAAGQGKLALMFQWKLFDHIGDEVPEALNHVLEESPEGVMKDISIYQSSVDNYVLPIKDFYTYEPKITKKGALLYRFFYDPSIVKYRLYSPQMLKELGVTAVGDLSGRH